MQISDLVAPEVLPVPAARSETLLSSPPSAAVVPTGTIYVELAKAKLRIEGMADPACVRAVLDRLLG